RLFPAAPVRRRSRKRAGAHRPHLEQPARIDPRDAAPACSDGLDVENARAYGKSRHFAEILLRRLATADQAHVGARAAHIDGDLILDAELSAEPGPADDATRGTGEKGIDWRAAYGSRRDRAAVRLHHARGYLDPERGHAPFEALEIAVHHRHQACVDGG